MTDKLYMYIRCQACSYDDHIGKVHAYGGVHGAYLQVAIGADQLFDVPLIEL